MATKRELFERIVDKLREEFPARQALPGPGELVRRLEFFGPVFRCLWHDQSGRRCLRKAFLVAATWTMRTPTNGRRPSATIEYWHRRPLCVDHAQAWVDKYEVDLGLDDLEVPE